MKTIKAIETEYNGYRFRSRLEARWAVFFDAERIKYEYESQGYILSDGITYLPDFYLPDLNAYVEIKSFGALNISFDYENNLVCFEDGREKVDKYQRFVVDAVKEGYTVFILQGDPYDVVTANHGGKGESHIFTMGKSVCCGCDCMTCYSFIGFINGKIVATDKIKDFLVIPKNEDYWCALLIDEETQELEYIECTPEEAKRGILNTLESARRARQARFEHGEKPRV